MPCLGQGTTSTKTSAIYFDDVPGKNDVEKLLQLPALIQSKQQTMGAKYSQGGGFPQPAFLHTTIKVIFPSRLYDFREVKEPVDMGHGFELVGEGQPIFECGKNGFIRFSQRRTLIEDIAFVGPYDNVPPLIVYGNGEPQAWRPNGKALTADEPKAMGTLIDGGDVQIQRCHFKGFGVALRCRMQESVQCGICTIRECYFNNVVQLSDNLGFDQCVIQNCWLLPRFESDKAFIVNYDVLLLRDILAVPQSDIGTLKNMRWVDNRGLRLDIRTCRFGNESVNKEDPLNGEQISLVYNWSKYHTTWTPPGNFYEIEDDKTSLIIENNWLYHRNVPVVKFFEIPNHVVIRGNTGLTGNYRLLQEKKDHDTSVLCDFAPSFEMPKLEMGRFITIDIDDNQRDAKITADDPDFLPGNLRYFGPKRKGTQASNANAPQ
jgi:hypothetical protein